MHSPLIQNLIDTLCTMPGVGRKSAQRIAFAFLQRQPQTALALAVALETAINGIIQCKQCRNLSETPICTICSNSSRENNILCVVESAIDLIALEESHAYKGKYFVLHGHLSPIDGIGPDELGISQLITLLTESSIDELILATNLTVEGEATAFYITENCQSYVNKITRIAHGVPLGGELEYVDGNTLAHAISGRK